MIRTMMLFQTVILAALMAMGCSGKENVDNNVEEQDVTIPDWEPGYMDIHQISTGCGDVAFAILPDGTTMLIDAGESYGAIDAVIPPRPNSSLRPMEWVARYIKHFSEPLGNNGALDYALLTHMDGDHIGTMDKATTSSDGKYKLTGITHIASLVDVKTLVDRGYPDYNYPSDSWFESWGEIMPNYKAFVKERDAQGKKNEKFVVGSNTQFQLKKNAGAYPDFDIRNIVGNGEVWTGEGTSVRKVFEAEQFKGENSLSCGIHIHYGDFDYITLGDIQGVNNSGGAMDVETEVAPLVENMDVVNANHHAYSDAMNETFIKATRPKAFVIPSRDNYHPSAAPLARMLNKELYPDYRYVFATGITDKNAATLGDNGKLVRNGHIVVRVYDGGKEFRIFVLDDSEESYKIIYQTSVLSAL